MAENKRLKLNDKLNDKAEASNLEIQKFSEYIKANTNDLGRINLQSLKEVLYLHSLFLEHVSLLNQGLFDLRYVQ